MKRYFRIEAQGIGGELVVGTISQEFLDHWKGNESELTEFIHDQDNYGDSPEMPAEEWHDVDDVEHITSATDDCQLTVVEVDEDSEEIGDESIVNETGDETYFREQGMLFDEIPANIKKDDKYVPAVVFFNVEKGIFFESIIETNGENFDEEKLHFGLIDTPYGCLIEQLWYDDKQFEIDHDVVSTRGKGMEAALGYINIAKELYVNKGDRDD
jgi:hypothetical protein